MRRKGSTLAQVEYTQEVVPQRPVALLGPRAAGVELVQVEQELDLDLALVTGELTEAPREGGRIEGGRSAGVHGDLQ